MRKNINKTDAPKNNDLITDDIMRTLLPGDTLKMKFEIKMSIAKIIRFNEIALQKYITKLTKIFLSKHEINEDKKTLES